MPLDPSIILHAGDALKDLPNYGQVVEARAGIQARQEAQQQQRAVFAEHQRQQQLLRDVGQRYAGGDVAGARTEAAGGGNFDLVKHLDQMTDDQRKRAFDVSQHAAPILARLSELPPEQRAAAAQQAAPLLQEAGWGPAQLQELQQNIGNPNWFSTKIAAAQTIEQYQKQKNEDRTYGFDREKFTADQADKAEQHQISREGNYLGAGLIPPNVDATPVEGRAPSKPGDVSQLTNVWGTIAPGVKPTSGYRTPAEQAALVRRGVTAATNSAHTSGNAIDVPVVPGLTAQAIQAAYAQHGVQVRVIQESGVGKNQGTGAHFHIERVGQASPSRVAGTLRPIPGGRLDHSAGADGTPTLTPDAIDNAAIKFNELGSLPAMGFGKPSAALRAQIMNRAAEIARAHGDTGAELLARQAERKANQSNLTNLTKRQGVITTAKNTALATGALLVSAASTGAGTSGAPLLNRWQQAYRDGVQGSPDVARFGLAVNTFANEYAKVISGATGAAGVAEGARQELLKHLSTASTHAQVRAIVAQAQMEMEASTHAIDGQISSTQGRLRGSDSLPTLTPEQVRAAPKGTRYRTTDGRIGVRP